MTRTKRNYLLGSVLTLTLALTAYEAETQDVSRTDATQPAAVAVVAEETQTPAPQKKPVGNPHELTPEELRTWSEFLSQFDCYGFLMSDYSTPLQADLGQVFYNGAGAGKLPTEEMLDEYLKANDFEEAYTDVTFIPYDAANRILERRTGYTLEHFKLAGNDIPMYYSDKRKGYFQMTGDTNRIEVECVSGYEYADGSVLLKSREKSWSDEPDADNESVSTFETTLKPDSQSGNMLFDTNAVTGGWILSLREWEVEPEEPEMK